jgi:hypothetical protein
MKSVTTKRFRARFAALPKEIQVQARRADLIWRDDPSYPALQFKQVKADVPPVYSVRIMNTGYRALGELDGDTMIWRWIGPHDEYVRMLK